MKLVKWLLVSLVVLFTGWIAYGGFFYLTNKDNFIISSGSMAPTLEVGDVIRVDRDAYRTRKPEAGEIVIFSWANDQEKTPFVFRIVALPGDRLVFLKGKPFINDKPIAAQEVLKKEGMEEYTETLGSRSFNVRYVANAQNIFDNRQMLMGPDDYFVIGDNRDNAKDSRYVGPISLGQILGRVAKIVDSPNKEKIGKDL